MADLINASDPLNQGRVKINKAIEQSERAEGKSDKAVEDSAVAKTTAELVQTQFDEVVGEGKNLFDPEARERNTLLNELGGIAVNSSYDTTAFIPVTQGNYVITESRKISIYDTNKEFLSHIDVLPMAVRVVNITVNGFVRVTFSKLKIETSMIERGDVPTSYEPHTVYLAPNVKVRSEGVSGTFSKNQMGFLQMINLFNPNERAVGMVLNELGGVTASSSYDTTEFIPVTLGKYTVTMSRKINIYNAQGVFLSHIDVNPVADKIVTVTENGFIRVSFSKIRLETSMIQRGETFSEFTPHTTKLIASDIKITSDNLLQAHTDVKKTVHFGDSITGNGTWVEKLAVLTGYEAHNVGFGATRLIDLDATGNPYTNIGMCDLVRAITSGDWTIVEAAVAEIEAQRQDNLYQSHLDDLKSINFNLVNYVTIMYGTNDINGVTVQLGEPNSTDTYNINGAMNYVLSTMMERFPNLRIFVLAPIFRPKMPSSEPPQNSDEFSLSNIRLYDIANAIGERAKEHKTPFKNMYYESGINKHNHTYYIGDGTHPNTDKGDVLLSEVIGRFITSH